MNNEEIQKIILAVSKELETNYERNKTEHYGLADRTLIPFATIESRSRVVRSEGTDEDRDIMICYDDENGWFIYDSIVQTGAGAEEIIRDEATKLPKEKVIEQYQKLNLFEKMSFISTAYDILCLKGNYIFDNF